MAEDKTILTRVRQVDGDAVNRLAERMLMQCVGHERIVAESACLLAWSAIAEGVRTFPKETGRARVTELVRRGTAEMCRLVKEVAAMSDAEVVAANRPAGAAN